MSKRLKNFSKLQIDEIVASVTGEFGPMTPEEAKSISEWITVLRGMGYLRTNAEMQAIITEAYERGYQAAAAEARIGFI